MLLIVGGLGILVSLCSVGYMYSGWHNSAYWGAGYTAVIGAIALTVLGALLAARKPARAKPVPRLLVGVPAAVLVAASVALLLATLLGQAVRWFDPADYHGRYGTRVTVQLPDTCSYDQTRYAGGATGMDANVNCDNAHWQADGRTVTGTAVIDGDDLNAPQVVQPPHQVEAYALGDKAYSLARVGRVENVAAYGAIALWWLPIAIVIALLSLLAMARVDWFDVSENR